MLTPPIFKLSFEKIGFEFSKFLSFSSLSFKTNVEKQKPAITQYPLQGIPIQGTTLKPYLVSDVIVTTINNGLLAR